MSEIEERSPEECLADVQTAARLVMQFNQESQVSLKQGIINAIIVGMWIVAHGGAPKKITDDGIE